MATPQEPIWPLEPHTKAKHELLRRYLGAWFPIMAKFNTRLVFLDGFAGPGIYSAGEDGSPVVALKTLLDHPHFPNLSKTEFIFIFFEPDKARFESLDKVLADLEAQCSGFPKNVRIIKVQTSFGEGASGIIADLGGKQMAPMFAFIDPFGWKDCSLKLIAQLLSSPKCEVFFNFMYDSINRWFTHPNPKNRQHFEDLFGTDEFLDADAMSGTERKEFLHDLYMQQLAREARFKYVRSFEMMDGRRRTAYYLFYGTRSLTGLKQMKHTMWKVDSGEGVRFSDRVAGQQVLLSEENVDVTLLRQAIVQEFSGKTVSVERVEEFVLADTPYSASHYKKILSQLEREDEGLTVTQSDRKKRYAFPAGTIMKFG